MVFECSTTYLFEIISTVSEQIHRYHNNVLIERSYQSSWKGGYWNSGKKLIYMLMQDGNYILIKITFTQNPMIPWRFIQSFEEEILTPKFYLINLITTHYNDFVSLHNVFIEYNGINVNKNQNKYNPVINNKIIQNKIYPNDSSSVEQIDTNNNVINSNEIVSER